MFVIIFHNCLVVTQDIKLIFTAVFLKKMNFYLIGLEREFSVVLESVLTGHEGWIYGVHWHPVVRKGN